jgi:hypothetical protein
VALATIVNPWVGLVFAALLAPFTAGIVAIAVQKWRRRDPRRTYFAAGACCHALIIVGVAISGYARSTGPAMIAAGFLGLLTRAAVAIGHARRRRNAGGEG